jgi:predicted ATPase with chaperone activity
MQQMQLSVLAYHRLPKLACIIADLAGQKDTQAPHIAESIRYQLQ